MKKKKRGGSIWINTISKKKKVYNQANVVGGKSQSRCYGVSGVDNTEVWGKRVNKGDRRQRYARKTALKKKQTKEKDLGNLMGSPRVAGNLRFGNQETH